MIAIFQAYVPTVRQVPTAMNAKNSVTQTVTSTRGLVTESAIKILENVKMAVVRVTMVTSVTFPVVTDVYIVVTDILVTVGQAVLLVIMDLNVTSHARQIV